MNVGRNTFNVDYNNSYIPVIFSSKVRKTSELLNKANDKVNFANDFCAFLSRIQIKVNSLSLEKFNDVVSINQAESRLDCKIIGKAFKEFKHSLAQDLTPEIISELSSKKLKSEFSKAFGKGDSFDLARLNDLYKKFVESVYGPNKINSMEEGSSQSEELVRKRKRTVDSSTSSTVAEPTNKKRVKRREAVIQDEENEVEEEEKEKEVERAVEDQKAEEIEKEKEVGGVVEDQNNPIDSKKLVLGPHAKIRSRIGKIVSKEGNIIFNGFQSVTLYCWNTSKAFSSDNSFSLTQTEFKKVIDFDVGTKYAAMILNPLRPLIYNKLNNALNLKKLTPINHAMDYLNQITRVKVFESEKEDNLILGFNDGNLIVYDLKNLEKRISFNKQVCTVYTAPGSLLRNQNVFPLGEYPIYSLDMLGRLVAASGSGKAAAVADLNNGSISVFRGYKTTVNKAALFDSKLFTASKKEVLIWDLTHFKTIYQKKFSLDKQEILTIIPEMYGYFRLLTKSNKLEHFDTRTNDDKPSFTFYVNESAITAVSKDRNDYYLGNENGDVFKVSY